jgi:phosphatidylglycerol lysyltransferase
MSTAAARELVMEHGFNATAYQVLNPGIEHWFSADGSGLVGYVRRRRVLLAAGDPVCAHGRLRAIVEAFEAFARAQGCRVCYVCAEGRLRRVLAGSAQHSAVAVGAQPVWSPSAWPQIVQHSASLRAQLNRARNKGVSVAPLPAAIGARQPELRVLLREWLGARDWPPMHFLATPAALSGVLEDRMLLVARRAGRAVAFLLASPVAARNGYLVEQIVRSPSAPNGTSELLVDAAMRRFSHQGRAFVTLGLVALAASAAREIGNNPLWLRMLMRWARAHANRFYNFRGLEHFRTKMLPERWEPVYAISNQPRFSVGTLYALGEAFAGNALWRAFAQGFARALRHEARTLAGLSRRSR